MTSSFFARGTRAETSVALAYQVLPGALGCGDGEGFQTRVQRQLGYDPFQMEADRRVAVRVSRVESGYEGRIQWTDATGSVVGYRRLVTRRLDCAEIVNNLAFAVAVQIQLLAALAPPAAEPAPAQSPAVTTEPAPELPSSSVPKAPEAAPSEQASSSADATSSDNVPPTPEVHPTAAVAEVVASRKAVPTNTKPQLRLSLGIGPSVALALAPHPTMTGRFFLEAQLALLSLELAFDGAIPEEQRGPTGAGFSLHRLAAEGAVCGRGGVLGACLTAAFAHMQANGFGVDNPRHPSGISSQVGGRLFAEHALGTRYFAAARIEGLVSLSRWTVTLNEASAWTTPRLSAVIGVDLGARVF